MSWPSARRSHTRSSWCATLLVALVAALLVTAAPVDAQEPRNGELPDQLLHPVGGVRLAADAAQALRSLLELAETQQVPVIVTDGYRTFDAQVDLKRRKPLLAATPGTSMHGWGRAIDVDLARTDMAWFHQHAPRFGWELPRWARPEGSKPEPWHWEYVGTPHAANRTGEGGPPVPGQQVAAGSRLVEVPIGTLLGHLRLTRTTTTEGRWIEIREGVEELTDVAGHYPGSALPGEEGNAAIAGYHRSTGAPLAGVQRLRPGDPVVIRGVDGAEHRYGLIARRELETHEVWALDPDPLGLGIERMLTVTTGSDDGRLLVSWFAPEPPARCPADPWSLEPCPTRRPSMVLQPR